MHKGQFSCYLDDVYTHLTEVTVEAWALDGKCRLAGSSVGAEGTQQNPWVLVDTELSEPEDAGQGRRASERASEEQPEAGWAVCFVGYLNAAEGHWGHSQRCLIRMQQSCLVCWVHLSDEWRLTHPWVSRAEAQLVEKRSTKSKVHSSVPSVGGTASQRGQSPQQPVWNQLGLQRAPRESIPILPWW